MKRRKPIIALCGGIGSGKSEAARVFASLGGLVIDSDRLNHEVQGAAEVLAKFKEWWGPGAVTEGGEANRRLIAEIVFSRPEERRRLESLVFPLIARRRRVMIRAGLKDPAVRAIILDSPLLFESKLDRLADRVVFIDAGPEQRLARITRTRGWDAQELDRREAQQAPVAEKKARSQHALPNDGSLEQLRERARALFERLISEFHNRR